MKEIISISGACASQARIKIRFDLEDKLKKLIEALIKEKAFRYLLIRKVFYPGKRRELLKKSLGCWNY